jgi:hypothetical protein
MLKNRQLMYIFQGKISKFTNKCDHNFGPRYESKCLLNTPFECKNTMKWLSQYYPPGNNVYPRGQTSSL